MRAPQGTSLDEGPGSIEIFYRPTQKWKKTFLHYTIRGADNWMSLPGEPMGKSTHKGFPSPPWRFLAGVLSVCVCMAVFVFVFID